MLRSSLLVVAVLIVSSGHAQQVSGYPQAPAPVAYNDTQLTVEDCNSAIAGTSGEGCNANREQTPVDDHAIADYADYVPDNWEEAPVYDAAPPVYLGISLIPDGYWGWPYYGFGYGYGYCCGYGYGWPYYGFATFTLGWPYYGYAGYWGGGHWGGSWHGHGHHDGDHGDWGHHDGDQGHLGDYHGPYRYMGHGRYADQGDGSSGGHAGHGAPSAGAATRTMAAANFSRAGASPASHGHFADSSAGSARTSARTNQFPGANRITGRAPLPSASYYAAARGTVGADRATSAYAGAATNYRAGTGYAYGRGNALSNTRNANQGYGVTSMPFRGYAPPANRGGAVARSNGNGVPQHYTGSRMSYPQQRYAPSNRAYAHAAMPPGSARGRMPAYSGARGAMPSYARGGSGSAPHGGHVVTAAPHSGSGGYSRSAHGH